MDVDLILRGASGFGTMGLFAGMLYFGLILMRVHRGRPAVVFLWSVLCQGAVLALMAVMSVVMRMFGYSMMGWVGGRGVDWIGMTSSVLEGSLLLSGLVGAVALVMVSPRRDRG